MCPAAGHGAWGDHRGVPGGPAEPQLERAEGCPVSEGTTTSCPLWLSGTLKTVLRLCSHSLPPSPHPPSSAPPWPSAPRPQCVPWHHPLLPRWSSSLVWVCGHEASATTCWRCSTGTWSRPAATCWAPAALPTTSEQTLHPPSSCPRASRSSHPESSQHCTARHRAPGQEEGRGPNPTRQAVLEESSFS